MYMYIYNIYKYIYAKNIHIYIIAYIFKYSTVDLSEPDLRAK